MAGTKKRLAGPVAASATLTTNVYNQGSALVYSVIKQIRVVNKTAGAVTFSLWLGATGANAAGTEVAVGISVPANGEYVMQMDRRMDSTDFLVGGASAGTSLSFSVDGEVFAV